MPPVTLFFYLWGFEHQGCFCVKKNSPGDCFLAKRCEDGYRSRMAWVVKQPGCKAAVSRHPDHNRTSTLIKCWCPIFSLNTAIFRHSKKYYHHIYLQFFSILQSIYENQLHPTYKKMHPTKMRCTPQIF